eukprot:6186721-Pleurochrysis_carterae.AAC.1
MALTRPKMFESCKCGSERRGHESVVAWGWKRREAWSSVLGEGVMQEEGKEKEGAERQEETHGDRRERYIEKKPHLKEGPATKILLSFSVAAGQLEHIAGLQEQFFQISRNSMMYD